ncbi:hypothetical protein RYX36_026603 [Vicia faba]
MNLPSIMDQVDFNALHSMGTIIIGVTYNGRVIPGADSRTSTEFNSRHSDVEGISQLTTVVPGTDESNNKLVQQLYKFVDLLKVKVDKYSTKQASKIMEALQEHRHQMIGKIPQTLG